MEESQIIKQKLRLFTKPEKIPFIKRVLATPFEVIGVMVPESRNIAKEYKNRNIYDIYNLFDELWDSRIHEEKSIAIHILQNHKKKFDIETWRFLRQRLDKAKTWDHIDWLATDIFAEILKNNPQLSTEVKQMANSTNHWERRLAMESTYKLIKQNKIDLTLRLAEKLIYDENEYVQKAAGWMLREAGKKQRIAVKDFILMHMNMKPIAFSYATEKMKELRQIKKIKISEAKGKKACEIFDTVPLNFNPIFEVVSCNIESNNKILLLHRHSHKPEGDTWGMPSGKINPNENTIEAIAREIKEETNLDIPKENLSFLKKLYVKYPKYDFIYHFFSTKLSEEPKIEINLNEHKDFAWATPKEALKMKLIPGLDECLKLIYK